MNVDAKSSFKILATRTKKVISQLISSDQIACVPDRSIGESVRLTSDVVEYMKASELPGYLISRDTENAFDSVDHTFLIAVWKKFGFGDDFMRWVRIILNRQASCIMNNGHSTDDFPLSPERVKETQFQLIFPDSVTPFGATLSSKLHGFVLYVTYLFIFSKRVRGEMSFQRGATIMA